MRHGRAWEKKRYNVVRSAPEDFRGGKNVRRMEGQNDCTNLQRERDIKDCGNYRGINMISHTMKIWERIIDRRLRKETSIGEGQFGFMPGRGTTDAIFAARQVIEKHREMQKELHMMFIDLEKAYDRVPRQEVWRCLREQGVPEKYVRLVKDTYEDARTQVKTSIGVTPRSWLEWDYIICRYPFTGRGSKDSEDIHIPGIDVGGGWRT